MQLLSEHDPWPEREGFKLVMLSGRAWPVPERAVERLRQALERDGIVVPDQDIWALEETLGAICPYTAVALVPRRTYEHAQSQRGSSPSGDP